MDLKVFYQKLRKIEQEIVDAYVILVSIETPDGGKAGQKTEATRAAAARLILEGRARLATPEETTDYRQSVELARQEAEQRAMAQKIQVNVVADSEFRAIKGAVKPDKR